MIHGTLKQHTIHSLSQKGKGHLLTIISLCLLPAGDIHPSLGPASKITTSYLNHGKTTTNAQLPLSRQLTSSLTSNMLSLLCLVQFQLIITNSTNVKVNSYGNDLLFTRYPYWHEDNGEKVAWIWLAILGPLCVTSHCSILFTSTKLTSKNNMTCTLGHKQNKEFKYQIEQLRGYNLWSC